jgi:hypothetical protein
MGDHLIPVVLQAEAVVLDILVVSLELATVMTVVMRPAEAVVKIMVI